MGYRDTLIIIFEFVAGYKIVRRIIYINPGASVISAYITGYGIVIGIRQIYACDKIVHSHAARIIRLVTFRVCTQRRTAT